MKQGKIVGLLILVYIIIFSTICVWKYHLFGYNCLDLAIFNQVFFNTATGHWFASSIHAPSFLGDHFQPIILLLLPFYMIYKQPITLLILQTVIIGLGAWPVYLIAREHQNNRTIEQIGEREQSGKKIYKYFPVFCVAAYLLNPFVQNMNLFEFHILPLAMMFILFAFYFYQKKSFWPFLSFIVLSVLVREDIPLIVFMFGVVALLDKRWIGKEKYQWIVAPMLLSVIYFLAAAKITSHFSLSGGYKFLIYYSWLGGSFLDIAKNLFLRFGQVLKHILSIGNLDMIFGFLLPCFFLPLWRPKYLLLALLPLAEIVLGWSGGSELILDTHYAALFLPALFVAFIAALSSLLFRRRPASGGSPSFGFLRGDLLLIILATSVVYSCVVLGPLPAAAEKIFTGGEQVGLKEQFVNLIPADASVATTYEFLPILSSRAKIYSIRYAFLGITQFAARPYALPEDTEYLLIDFSDLFDYQVQFPKTNWAKDYYAQGDDNLRKILVEGNFGAMKAEDTIVLFKRNYKSDIELYNSLNTSGVINEAAGGAILDNKIKFLNSEITRQPAGLDIQLEWQALRPISEDYQLQLELADTNGKMVYQKVYPLAYGLYPTSEWKKNEIVQINYWLQIPPEHLGKDLKLSLGMVRVDGLFSLNGWRSGEIKLTKTELLGNKIYLKE